MPATALQAPRPLLARQTASRRFARDSAGFRRPLGARRVVCAAAAGAATEGRHPKTAVAAAALAAALMFAGPATAAGLDTDTFKAGVKATVEASDITKQKADDVVGQLKEEVLPDVKEKLGRAADQAGSSYPASVVKELDTVESEVAALDKQAAAGGSESNVKSAASGVEQQINALKGILGFD